MTSKIFNKILFGDEDVTHTSLSSSNLNKELPLFIPRVMANKIPNLDQSLPDGCQTFFLNKETGVNLITLNSHYVPFKPVRASRQPKFSQQVVSSQQKQPT